MAIYRAGAEPSPIYKKMKRQAAWRFAGSLLLLILFILAILFSPVVAAHYWLAVALNTVTTLLVLLTVITGVITLTTGRTRRQISNQEFEVTPAGIGQRYPGHGELFVPAANIVSFRTSGHGVFLQLKENPRVMLVPANIENVEGLLQELTAMGVPQGAPPPWHAGILKFLAIQLPIAVSGSLFFWAKTPIERVAGAICYGALMIWVAYRGSRLPYQKKRWKWIWIFFAAMWIGVIALNVERAFHPCHTAVPAPFVDQPSSAHPKR